LRSLPRISAKYLGIGLRDNGRKVLSYAMLKSAFKDSYGRNSGRNNELHLKGNMEKFA